MNSLYAKIISVVVGLIIIVALVFAVLWQNNRTIDSAADRASDSMAQLIAAQRAEDALLYERRIAELEGKVSENYANARLRVAELDQRQRRSTADLLRRIGEMPDAEVSDPIAAVLEQSRERWPE